MNFRCVLRCMGVVLAMVAARANAAATTESSVDQTSVQQSSAGPSPVEQWGLYEISLVGPATGNPFIDVDLTASFTNGQKTLKVHGFYDGDGIYRIRFMPPETGSWKYQTQSNCPALNGQSGSLVAVAPMVGHHGLVRVHNTYHFAYADGTPYVEIGTTSYSWIYSSEAEQEQTLATLKASPFDKLRMSLLPTRAGPNLYPYPQDSAGKWDPSRFNVAYFQNLEKRVSQLNDEGVQADLILFHPYNKGSMAWFDALDDAADDRYINYVIARLAAYPNVWWSLANEYGQVKNKTDADWDHFFQVVQADDPYDHLRSIHNAQKYYDPNKPWVTHASIQNGNAVNDFGRAVLYRHLIPKPVVYDEVCYEGNAKARWGQLSGEDMVSRFWFGTIAGTYVGHSETFGNGHGGAWISNGGKLLGQSPPRLAFLRKILEEGPADGIEPIDEFYDQEIGGKAGEYYLVYFGYTCPTQWTFTLPVDPPEKKALVAGMKFHVDLLDTWNMTITPVDHIYTVNRTPENGFRADGQPLVMLPGKPWMALRIQRVP